MRELLSQLTEDNSSVNDLASLKKYLDREMQIKESVFQQLFKHQNSASAAERMEELKQEIILTQEALKYYE